MTSTRSMKNLVIENIRSTPMGNIFRGQVHDKSSRVYRFMYYSSHDHFFLLKFLPNVSSGALNFHTVRTDAFNFDHERSSLLSVSGEGAAQKLS